ncbi:MAG: hypothetical protein LQ343_003846 [Gyalolechia ehrenbergii]|nr:MAG: hypothetical protein LQ343_003846 [Gyalolechia ehrenbergii]
MKGRYLVIDSSVFAVALRFVPLPGRDVLQEFRAMGLPCAGDVASLLTRNSWSRVKLEPWSPALVVFSEESLELHAIIASSASPGSLEELIEREARWRYRVIATTGLSPSNLIARTGNAAERKSKDEE